MSLTGKARIAGVFGWPVAHSRSPALHNFWLAEHKIDGAYIPLPVAPEHFERAARALPLLGFAGANVTVPHKQAALALADTVDPLAKRIGAVNTLVIGADGSLAGSNTDAFGFIENLRQAVGFKASRGPAVMLGAGGSARAVAARHRACGHLSNAQGRVPVKRRTADSRRSESAERRQPW